MISLDRDIQDTDYVDNMFEIVEKQAQNSNILANITKNQDNFKILSYAASGNPRILLKTLSKAPDVSNQQINNLIREYYRTDIWSEHSALAEKFVGHSALIDWGRIFIETSVLPEIKKKNDQTLEQNHYTSCYFWIHRDAPEQVKKALSLLAYTGIVKEHASGIKATRGEIGKRYMVNLGCLLALEAASASTATFIVDFLIPKRMTEYGINHAAFQQIVSSSLDLSEPNMAVVLHQQLDKPIDVLDISYWQLNGLKNIGINNIRDILNASEEKLQEIYYVGQIRSRRMKNVAVSAVYEYLSG